MVKIVEMKGRLGNQMFIYAFAKALEYYTQDKVYFDTTFYINNATNTLELENVFGIKLEEISPEALKRIKKRPFENVRFIQRHKKIFKFLLQDNWVRENKANKYQPNLFAVRGDLYYSGYFQCEQYFKEIESEIRRVFTFKPVKDEKLIKLREEIEGLECPVFVNVRRGDYVTLDRENVVHWLCDMSYYQEATRLMKEKYPNCTFVAVSDEPEWLRENLKIDYPFKIYTSGTPYLDIYLLQACKHGICANSSYSWWAAWLIDNPEKTIIAPDPWLDEWRDVDIICDDWIKLPRLNKR